MPHTKKEVTVDATEEDKFKVVFGIPEDDILPEEIPAIIQKEDVQLPCDDQETECNEQISYEQGYEQGYRDGIKAQRAEESSPRSIGGQANGAASRITPELSAAAAELADLILGTAGAPTRALVLAATISGLLGTTSGKPTETTSSVVTKKTLVVGGIYIGHRGPDAFEWEFLGSMPNDPQLFRLRRKDSPASVERFDEHGLTPGGPKGFWTEFSGMTRDGIEKAFNAVVQSDDELPEAPEDVLAT